MKKQILVTLTIALVISFIVQSCDDGTKKETPGVPQPTQKTLSFGKVTISSPDEHLPSAWIDLCNDVVTALESAYTNAIAPAQTQFSTVFGGGISGGVDFSDGVEIILVNNLTNNWEVRQGESKTLYLKIGSIATADYLTAVQRMFAGGSGVG